MELEPPVAIERSNTHVLFIFDDDHCACCDRAFVVLRRLATVDIIMAPPTGAGHEKYRKEEKERTVLAPAVDVGIAEHVQRLARDGARLPEKEGGGQTRGSSDDCREQWRFVVRRVQRYRRAAICFRPAHCRPYWARWLNEALVLTRRVVK
jgi:hypothetical protein